MGTRPTTKHSHVGVWSRLIPAIATVSFIFTLGATSASAAKSATCSVTNTDTGRTYTRLQSAVDAAEASQTLLMKGTCTGRTDIRKDLTIEGLSGPTAARPSLLGHVPNEYLLNVMRGVSVTLGGLTIRGGRTPPDGGGIQNRGTLTLRDVVVRDFRRGVLNQRRLTLSGGTAVKDNRATWCAGVDSNGTLVMNDTSRISGNSARHMGGGVCNDGSLVMNDASRITRNRAGYWGGGIHNWDDVILNDTSHISGNRAGRGGGGVFNALYGSVTLTDAAHISRNRATDGGGVLNHLAVTLNGTSHISDNTARDDGGGVLDEYGAASLTMHDAAYITGNKAHDDGGGLWHRRHNRARSRVVCAPETLANVYGNTPDDCFFE